MGYGHALIAVEFFFALVNAAWIILIYLAAGILVFWLFRANGVAIPRWAWLFI
jgi:hypothetical protein